MKPLISSDGAVPRRGMLSVAILVLASCLTVGSAGAAGAGPSDQGTQTEQPTAAKWAPRKLSFMYSAIAASSRTTYYSCDTLQQQITTILRQLGAGEDLVVKPMGCIGPGGPQRFPGVEATFSVLEPAAADGEGATQSQVLSAHWHKVTLDSQISCELLEQVKRRVLPLFATRNVTSDCPPRFSVEVLRPVRSSQSLR